MQLTDTKIALTSLEIAELTAKKHMHVKRDIEVQLKELGDVSKFGCIYKDSQNALVDGQQKLLSVFSNLKMVG